MLNQLALTKLAKLIYLLCRCQKATIIEINGITLNHHACLILIGYDTLELCSNNVELTFYSILG